jgi:hypothetical protein
MRTIPALRSFAELVGQTLSMTSGSVGDDELRLFLTDGRVARLYHDQDCCEHVAIEDIAGDLYDLIGEPILTAEESTSDEFDGRKSNADECDSCTWTFYRIGTIKGSVVIRWLGRSNGYYSERVDFECSAVTLPDVVDISDPLPLRGAGIRRFDLDD